jgi:ribosomal protein L40E
LDEVTDTVISVRSRASTITQWASSVNNLIQSGTPILYEEAKTKLLEGEKLNVNCQEVRTLRNAVKMTRGWIGRVKKLDLEQGSSDVNIITELLKEHETLLVSSPEYASKLKQAVCNYCICRRPYDGFMIGCDECDEWYHGLCVGVSEAQAEKFDKYICVRCSIKKSYYQLCSSIACTIKKWCDPKELLKVRQNDGQKLQRRIREKKREILKLHEEMESNTRLLQSLSKEGCSTSTFDSTSHTDVYDNTTRPTTHLSHVSNVDVNYPTSMNKQSESICPSSHGSYNTDFPHQEKNDIDAFANDQVPCDGKYNSAFIW